MNWSTAILLFLAWQLLSNNQSSPKIQDMAPFLNEDTRGILDGVSKLSSPTATSEDKTGAIFQMMTNPTIMNFAQTLFGGDKGSSASTNTTPQQPPSATQQNPQATPYSQPSGQFDYQTTTTQGYYAPQFAQPTPPFGTENPPQGACFPPPQTGMHTQSAFATGTPTPTHSQTISTTYEPMATAPQNDEGYTFASPTERAKQFFAPIDTIATAEIKHKLCYFYDNWYLAK